MHRVVFQRPWAHQRAVSRRTARAFRRTAANPDMDTRLDWSLRGLQIGYGWGVNAGSFSYATPDGFNGIAVSWSTPRKGVLVGAHLGYNRQFDNWVVGLEGSVDGSNLEKRELLGWADPNFGSSDACFVGSAGCGGSIDARIRSDLQGSLRARLGYGWNCLLVYGVGGVALANFNLRSYLGEQSATGAFLTSLFAANDRSTLRVGWTGGLGAEYAISNHWSARAEYRYSDFGHIRETPTSLDAAGLYYQGVPRRDPEPGAGRVLATDGGEEPEIRVVTAPLLRRAPPGPLLAMNWTGFYIGGQAGYAYGVNHAAYEALTPAWPCGQRLAET